VAKLAGGVAVIKVGAATEVEMKEKRRPAWKTPCTLPALLWKKALWPVVAWLCCAPSKPLATIKG
jgi:chaperonin GroEL (HSP60 family)